MNSEKNGFDPEEIKKSEEKTKEMLEKMGYHSEEEKEIRWDDTPLLKYKEKLAERLRKDNPYWAETAYDKIAERDIYKINPILEKNLVEYVNGEPLSDIKIGSEQFSVNLIISLWKCPKDVLDALVALSMYSVDERIGRIKIMGSHVIK